MLIYVRNSKQVISLGATRGATMLYIHGKNELTAVRVRSQALKQGGSDSNLESADFIDSPFSTHFKLDNHQVGYDNLPVHLEKWGPGLSVPEDAVTMQ